MSLFFLIFIDCMDAQTIKEARNSLSNLLALF